MSKHSVKVSSEEPQDYVLVTRSSIQPSNICLTPARSSIPTTKVMETDHFGLDRAGSSLKYDDSAGGVERKTPQIQQEDKALSPVSVRVPSMMLKNLFNPGKVYTARLTGAVVAIATSAAATATAKVPWDPTGLSEFTSWASLFGEYRLRGLRFNIWPQLAGNLAAADSGKNPSLILYGSDPAMIISGTPTDVTVGSLAHVVRFLPNASTQQAIKLSVKGVERAVALLAPTADGFILTSAAWSGQSCFYTASTVSGSVNQLAYQIDYFIDFKARG